MIAYHFLAYDMSGLTLTGTTDDGECLWIGNEAQWSNAEMQKKHFEEYGKFFEEEEYTEDDFRLDEAQANYERDEKMSL